MRLRDKYALCALLLVLAAPPAWAHGTILTANLTEGVELRATFDTGEAMAQAQVTVFAPSNPTQIWMHGTTDQDGRFAFVPDRDQPGTWTVQVRQAGHGAIVNVTTGITGIAQPTPTAPAQTLGQQLLMIALVVWGALGTALFFHRRKGVKNASA